jgi:outer membrane protein
VFSVRACLRVGLVVAVGLVLTGRNLMAQGDVTAAYSLGEVIGLALQNNRELREAQLGLFGADEQVREAWGSLFPTIDGSVGYQRNLAIQDAFLPKIIFDPNASPNELVKVRFGADNNWSAWLYVTQPIFDAGAFVGVGTAGRFQALQREAVRGQAQRVASQVRRSYYQALLAREEVRLTDESIVRTEQSLRETQGMYRAGLASSYDVLRLEVRLANLRPNLKRAGNVAAAVERDLSVQLGFDEVTPVRVAGQLRDIDLAALDANEGANREIVRLELENARLKYEQTSRYPRLNAFFNAGLISQEDGSLDPFGENKNQRTTSAVLGVSLEVPIFQGFQRSARIEQRRIAREQANVQLKLLEQQAANQIRTALEALEEARERAQAQEGAVAQARRGYEIVTAQYLAGVSSQLEVTEGEVLLRESEFNYAQAVYDYLVAQTDLDDAVGVAPLVDVPSAVGSEVSVSE